MLLYERFYIAVIEAPNTVLEDVQEIQPWCSH